MEVDKILEESSSNITTISGRPCHIAVQLSNGQNFDHNQKVPRIEIEGNLWRQDSDKSDSVRSSDGAVAPSRSSRRSCRHESRRLRRSVSAREAELVRPKVKRSISERGEHLIRHHRHHRRLSQRSRPVSYSGITAADRPTFPNNLKNGNVSSLSDSGRTVAVELGPTETPGGPKETRRKHMVFAVVLISLAILTASVLLVTITLLLSPGVDNVIRKENQEIFRVWSSTSTPQEGAQNALANQTYKATGQPV
ncbi:uncharacterized protein LOC111086894 [Limulus polyphemus]|uniref:Uncharacterized protein LOC111086894 n=1 Tax=Limulus polyphemus TaxID=6850 RepID=A0ABM1SUJ3_LIMPO|nr:uncharacterized protein LOC111086894 [Limulus polyphemus]XP_022247299.1 uncharacterized protein LOC111086894 [Limulus polyphemus]